MAATITLTAGVGTRGDGEVVQRTSATGASGIHFEGEFTDIVPPPTSIEVQVVADPHGATVTAWTPLGSLVLDRGAWRGYLQTEVPIGSYYNTEVRALREGVVVASNLSETAKWGVGAVVLLAGQSNMVDMISPGYADSHTVAGNASCAAFGPWFHWFKLDELEYSAIPGATHNFWFAGALWGKSGKTLTVALGEFTSYVWAAGDQLALFSLVTPEVNGIYTIASKVSNNQITLVEDIGDDGIIVGTVPRPRGLANFADNLHTAYVGAGLTMPLGFVNGAMDGTAMRIYTDFVSGTPGVDGHWLGEQETSTRDPYIACKSALAVATSKFNTELICWQQGETDGWAANFIPTISVEGNYYYNSLTELFRNFERDFYGVNGNPTITMATVAGNAGDVSVVNFAHLSQFEQVREQQLRFARDTGRGVCALQGVERQADQLHYTPAGQETFGIRLAEVAAADLGFAGHASTGPKIIGGRFGDEITPTLDSRTHITVYVQHDTGTDLTVPANNHVMWEVEDELGPLYVESVTKGVTAGGIQPLVLSLERNTANTVGKDRPYDAPDHLVGNIAFVRYAAYPTVRADTTINHLITDNSTFNMPLLTTYGVDDYEKPLRSKRTRLGTLPNYDGRALICKIIDVTNLAGLKQVVLDNPDGAAPNGWTPIGLAFNQLRPGDRVLAEEGAPNNGDYIGESTLRYVTAYTNESTNVTVELGHNMAGQAPTNADYLTFVTNSKTVGSIMVWSRNSDSFGI